MNPETRLLPEWYPQEAILLTWPDAKTDWAQWLPEVQNTYKSLIEAINQYACPVILLIRSEQIGFVQEYLPVTANVLLLPAEYNDTWIRDYGFLTCTYDKEMYPVSFQFNGWGNKFHARTDNKVNLSLLAQLCRHHMVEHKLVLEGGALEINEDGTLLSTQLCLTNPERNGDLSLADYTQQFAENLGATQTHILKNGHLEGDDTDGHIDTLVRFTPDNDLVIQSAFNRPDDSHYKGLYDLVVECQTLFPQSKIFELPLPFISDEEGNRLPASYANFLISNGNVFAPVYEEPEDEIALDVLRQAYSQFRIVPINCRPLVQQFGSLHCISMQVPTNTIKPEIIKQAQSGVSVYGN